MTEASPRKVAVVGGGLVGLAVGHQLSAQGSEVHVFEKEDELAKHQSGHNSGVVHSGIYYVPGSLKAVLCRRGVGLLRKFCAEHDLEYNEIGKVIVARNDLEVGRLRDIQSRGEKNGVPGVQWLDAAALRELEPNVRGVAALHSPTTAIVDYRAIAREMAADIERAGGRVHLSSKVDAIAPSSSGVRLHTNDKRLEFHRAVLCAGLQADVTSRLAGDQAGPAIVAFRGEYFRLVPERANLVNGLVYPVPDPAYPFLGVHVTPRIDGSVDIGPNAVLALAREGYRRRDINLRDMLDVVRWPGARKLFRAHWRAGMHEMHASLSKRAFVGMVQEYVPDLRVSDVVRAPAGVRAQAVDKDGALVEDFRISRLGPITAIRNAPSPAATSCMAIAEHIVAEGRLSQ